MPDIHVPSELFPFRLDQLEHFQFEQYELRRVFGKITNEQREQCIRLWTNNGVIASVEAARSRSSEVCYMLYKQEGQQLIGVNTLYQGQVTQDGPKVWLNRMFIDPNHRQSRLMIVGTAMMLCFAKTHLANQGLPGVVNINENRKLSRPGMQRIFHRLGYRRLGWQNEQEVIMFKFSNINLIAQ